MLHKEEHVDVGYDQRRERKERKGKKGHSRSTNTILRIIEKEKTRVASFVGTKEKGKKKGMASRPHGDILFSERKLARVFTKFDRREKRGGRKRKKKGKKKNRNRRGKKLN